MKIKVLGSAGSEVPGHNCPAFLIDGKILLEKEIQALEHANIDFLTDGEVILI